MAIQSRDGSAFCNKPFGRSLTARLMRWMLASMTDEELNAKYAEHGYAVFSFDAQLNVCATNSSHHEDLVALLMKSKSYVVDSPISWKKIAALKHNKDTFFIIGRTVLDEDNDIGHLFKEEMLTSRNLLVMSPYRSEDGFEIYLHRLDKILPLIFSEDSLKEVKEKTGKFQEWVTKREADIDIEKQEILQLLKIKDISELKKRKPADNLAIVKELADYIHQHSHLCWFRFGLSAFVARHCYAFLLASKFPKIRNEFKMPDYINVFGDTGVLQNALFFGAGLLTRDLALRQMADEAGVENDIERVESGVSR